MRVLTVFWIIQIVLSASLIVPYLLFRSWLSVVYPFIRHFFCLITILYSLRPSSLTVRCLHNFRGLLVEQTIHFTSNSYSFLVFYQAGLRFLLFNFRVHVLKMISAHAIPCHFEHQSHFKSCHGFRERLV